MHRTNLFKLSLFSALIVLFAAGQALAELPKIADLAEKAGPAVVNIFTETAPKQSQRQPRMQIPRGTPFDDFFEQFDQYFNQHPQQQQKRSRSLGSGFLISADGYIITNNHVVEKADKVNVKLQKGEKVIQARVVGADPETDLALLKIDNGSSLPFLKLGDSAKLRVGDWVVAIGNPFGLAHTVTAGIVSAKGRVIGAGPYDDFIQTDASINPGNSGGPLLNLDGEVVGINAAIIASGQGIGFAIPSNIAKDVVAQLKSKGKVSRGMLGVTIQSVDENTAKALGLSDAKGALVSQVGPGSAAEKAGLASGDVIIAVNGQPVADSHDLTTRIGNMNPGEPVTVTYLRKGKSQTAKVTLMERDAKALGQMGDDPAQAKGGDTLGMTLSATDPRTGKPAGGLLVVDVTQNSAAAEAGLRRGDVIVEINQRPVATPEEAASIIEKEGKARGAVVVLFKRQGQPVFRSIPVQ
ncbi:Periplasmic pH-dependent serine endoprotease DegQ [Fundidesulfovibrio magnetotacticus]|uniref:Probable periplasmic serine endoprotease DegP-like n=1 Tax=Fundidesulfovibrio magnetotacticus TaxID=2730080 RepID=A0A6V8LXG9_9BACT|nr:DegQ family serine endoprotease [Fundidesulfovibrio magnetotacticus]GFK95580.1 Periplasmic pH-dependent serine endoprotease DegQ [Fundidesulfovibrio magnetotacticus]